MSIVGRRRIRVDRALKRRLRMSGLLLWMFRIAAVTVIAVPSRTVMAQVATIGSGVTATGLVVNSGGEAIDVLGTANHSTLGNGGAQWVEAGGTTSGTVINAGGLEVVSSGGLTSASQVNSAGSQSVFSGGTANGTHVNSNGMLTVSSGGIANGATVNSSGQLFIEAGGVATGINQTSGAALQVDTLASAVSGVNAAGTFSISGGVASSVLLENGGTLTVSSGGTTSATIIRQGGVQDVLSGGVASNTIDGSQQIISAGGVAYGTVLSNGTNTVLSGGAATGSIIGQLSFELVSSGGSATSAVVTSGGMQTVLSGATANGTIIDSAGKIVVSSGGIASGIVQSSGGALVADTNAGLVSGTNANGTFSISGGVASGVLLEDGGQLTVSSGGVASATMVGNGGTQVVMSGGVAYVTSIEAGGVQTIGASGLSVNAVVDGGGIQTLSSTATAVGTVVRGGGQQIVNAGAVELDATVSSGGEQIVSGNGRNETVVAGGTQIVTGPGVTSATLVTGGNQIVLSGGLASATALSAGGTQSVEAGGTANATTVGSGGLQMVSSGGLVSGTTVNSGGSAQVLAGGVASAGVVVAGGTQAVLAGALAVGTAVGGGVQTVASGGIVSATIVNSGGTQSIQSGGIATGTIIANAGTQNVSSGGMASATTVSSGGTQIIYDGGVVSGSTLTSGGIVRVLGTVANASIGSSSELLIGSGGTTGALAGDVLNDGQLTFNRSDDLTYANLMTGSGTLTQAGPGTLTLTGDNRGFSGTTIVSAGTLQIGDQAMPTATLGGTVQVASAGTLAGTGSVVGMVVNGGNVQPGVSVSDAVAQAAVATRHAAAPLAGGGATGTIGTLTINGNYTQTSNGVLTVEVAPTAASQLVVTGNATLNGVLKLLYDPGTYASSKTFVIVSAGSTSGRFSSVTAGGQAATQVQQNVQYGPEAVDLVVDNATSTTGTTGSTSSSVVAPSDASMFSTLGTSLVLTAQMVGEQLLGRALPPCSEVDGGDTSTCAPARHQAWAVAQGDLMRVGGNTSIPGFDANQYLFMAGQDWQTGPSTTLGVGFSYGHSDIAESDTGDSSRADTLRLSLYGAQSVGPVSLSGALSYAYDDLHTKRPFGAIGTADGSTGANEAEGGVQASMPLRVAGVTVAPRVGLQFAYWRANAYTESGAGGQDLTVASNLARSLQPYVGLTLDKQFGGSERPVDVQFNLNYAHEILATARAAVLGAQDGTVFDMPGASLPHAQLSVGVHVEGTVARNLRVGLGYSAWLNTGAGSQQSAQVTLRYAF